MVTAMHPFYLGRKQIPLFPFPKYEKFTSATWRAFEETDRLFRSASKTDAIYLMEWVNRFNPRSERRRKQFSILRHELSDHFRMINPAVSRTSKTKTEILVLNSHSSLSYEAVLEMGFEPFRQFLCSLATGLTGADVTAFRSIPVGLMPDRMQNTAAFPDAGSVTPRLKALQDYLNQNSNRPAAFRALLVLASIVNCHPLEDGNGRLSRTMYNWVMRELLGAEYYLPIHEISALCDGGFVIRLRAADHHGDWEEIATFFATALNLILSLNRKRWAMLERECFS